MYLSVHIHPPIIRNDSIGDHSWGSDQIRRHLWQRKQVNTTSGFPSMDLSSIPHCSQWYSDMNLFLLPGFRATREVFDKNK